MPLEDITNPQRTNIKSLVLEEPVKRLELPFDPERDITKEDWEGMKEYLEILKTNAKEDDPTNWGVYSELAVNMKLLFPQKYAEEIEIDYQFWPHEYNQLEEAEREAHWAQYGMVASIIKMLDPNIFSQITLSKDYWPNALEQMKRSRARGGHDWLTFRTLAHSAVLLFPERRAELGLDDEVFENLKSLPAKGISPWPTLQEYMIREYSTIRTLFPDKLSELNITNQDWNMMRDDLDDARQKAFSNDIDWWETFATCAAGMKVLVAQDLRIADQGLEIIMPRQANFSPKTQSLPETRKF